MILVTLNIFLCISLALSDDSLVTGINKFSLDLLNSLADSGSNENVLYSPISLHTALSQVLYGAEGNTQTELRTALGVRPTEGLVRQYRDIRRRNQNLKTSNIIALHRGFSPKPTFINRLRAGFNSRVEEFDMVGDKTGTINEINREVASVTENKIQNLLSEQDVGPDTKMILVNAVFFKANWKNEFDESNTFCGKFQTSKLGTVMTKFMSQKMKAKLTQRKNLDVLQLPYDDESTSMIIFLPKEGKNMKSVINFMSSEGFQSLENTPNTTKVEVVLPRFKFEYTTQLKQQLQELGIKDLFTRKANLRKISARELFVSDGVHKAFIEVDEKGTEAAAATGVSFATRTKIEKFEADRPFMFMIYDSFNKIPLFVGKLASMDSDNSCEKKLRQAPS